MNMLIGILNFEVLIPNSSFFLLGAKICCRTAFLSWFPRKKAKDYAPYRNTMGPLEYYRSTIGRITNIDITNNRYMILGFISFAKMQLASKPKCRWLFQGRVVTHQVVANVICCTLVTHPRVHKYISLPSYFPAIPGHFTSETSSYCIDLPTCTSS